MTGSQIIKIARSHAYGMRRRVRWVDVDEATSAACVSIARAMHSAGDKCDVGLVVRAAWCGVRDYVRIEYRARRWAFEVPIDRGTYDIVAQVEARDAISRASKHDERLIAQLALGVHLSDIGMSEGVTKSTVMRRRDRLREQVQS